MVINGDLYGILWDLMMFFSVMGFSGIHIGNWSIKNEDVNKEYPPVVMSLIAQSKSNLYHGVDIYIIHGWFQPSYFYHITIIKIMVFLWTIQKSCACWNKCEFNKNTTISRWRQQYQEKNCSLRMNLAQDCLKKKRIIQRYREIMEI